MSDGIGCRSNSCLQIVVAVSGDTKILLCFSIAQKKDPILRIVATAYISPLAEALALAVVYVSQQNRSLFFFGKSAFVASYNITI